MGVGRENVVGLYLERGSNMPIAMLGVLKAGAAYLPIGLDEPSARRKQILDDSRPSVILTQPATCDRLVCDVPVVDLTRVGDEAEPFRPEADDAAAAYVVYTSGSTGSPRGVVVEHRNLRGHIDWLKRHLPLGSGDRVLQVAPYTFDASVTDFFWPLSCGAAVVSLEEGEEADPGAIASKLARLSITAVRLPPVIVPHLLAEPALTSAAALRYVVCGGDRLPVPVARRMAQALPRARVFNRYGPTEAAVAVTYHEFVPAEHFLSGDVPIGEPVGGARLLIESGGRIGPPAPGQSGELLVGGSPVARGYVLDDAATRLRFSEVPGVGRIFRTGDLVRVTDDGTLLFAGRADGQVKVAGHRVEPGEISAALCAHPEVADCAVVLGSGDNVLKAYVVVRGQQPDESEIRAFLLARIPRYMVPGHVQFVERLPTGQRGKLDLRDLG
jgi:amino acid adenylation domain-containing protein